MIEIIVPALSGILGAGVGAFGTYKAAKMRLKSEVISKTRRDWLEDLRSCVAEFQSSVNYLNGAFTASSKQQKLMSDSELNDLMNRSGFLKHRIKLLVNPKEDKHDSLVEKVEELHKALLKVASSNSNTATGNKSVTELQGELTEKARSVLKEEWEQIKKEVD